MDAGGRATQDAGGRATQDAKAENNYIYTYFVYSNVAHAILSGQFFMRIGINARNITSRKHMPVPFVSTYQSD